jgi:predicted secreted protein
LVKTDEFGNMEWNRTYGGTLYDSDHAYSLVATSDGGYALAGSTETFGAGGDDFWLIKTDALGNVEWNRTYGGVLGEEACSLVVTSDGGYALAGETYGAEGIHAWLVKTDEFGNMEWNRTYGGTDFDRAYSLVATSDGGYAIAGYTIFRNASISDFWLVKTDALGVMEWSQTYGRTGRDSAHSLVATSDGGYAIAGDTNSSDTGSDDYWLVKTDWSGNMEWSQTYGGVGNEGARSLVATSDGGYAIAGYKQSFGNGSETDFWLIKIN